VGWSVLPEPGNDGGPCKDKCDHTDCAWTRRAAESKCRFCNEPIGYMRGFYLDSEQPVKSKKNAVLGQTDETFVHSSCQQEAIEKERLKSSVE